MGQSQQLKSLTGGSSKNLNSTARPYDQRAFSLTPLSGHLANLHSIYIFVVVNFDALAQASDIQIERRQVMFLCWMQDLNPGPQTPKLADWMLTDKPTELSRIKQKLELDSQSLWSASIQPTWPHCQLTFAPGSGVYIFVVVNFDALAQASEILHSAEEHNLSPFDLNIACLCQSIEINNNMYIARARCESQLTVGSSGLNARWS